MRPSARRWLSALVLGAVGVGLLLIFPRALLVAELAARELRYLWWLVLLAALGCWLIWGFKSRS